MTYLNICKGMRGLMIGGVLNNNNNNKINQYELT